MNKPKNFPDGADIHKALQQADRPLTTVEVHRAACKIAGVQQDGEIHAVGGTLTRLDRLFHNHLISTGRNGNDIRVWFIPTGPPTYGERPSGGFQ